MGGRSREIGPGEAADLPPGIAHEWWNAADEEAQLIVEVDPGDRFELMLSTIWGLASAGRTNAKGIPNPLQLAVVMREFDDIVRFVKPPRLVQLAVFGALAPIGRAAGYLPVYGRYIRPVGRVEPDPEVLALAGLEPVADHAQR